MKKHYVEMYFPGFMFDETAINEVPFRNNGDELPERITDYIDVNCFAFRFHTQDVLTVEDEEFSTAKYKYSQLFYFGTSYSLDQIKTEFPAERILISNMENNDMSHVVKTRWGNFKPLYGDEVVLNYIKDSSEFFYDDSFDEYKI